MKMGQLVYSTEGTVWMGTPQCSRCGGAVNMHAAGCPELIKLAVLDARLKDSYDAMQAAMNLHNQLLAERRAVEEGT